MRAPINARLKTLATLIRDGAVLADVGTDHAYLAIYMLSEGRITFAHLSDINEEPLNRARRNVSLYSFSDRVDFHLTNGARDLAGLGITDYAIAGMGGETIVKILEQAPWTRECGTRLLLQPQSGGYSGRMPPGYCCRCQGDHTIGSECKLLRQGSGRRCGFF